MTGISATIIVRNEAARLPACLDALRPAVDEVVVVDTGSDDASRDIAARAGARCLDFPWCDDFAAARNAALAHATRDWVLVVDADEQLRDGVAAGAALRAFAGTHGDGVMGTVAIVSPTEPGPGAPVVVDHTLRFFHRRRVRYEGRIHEQPVHDGPGARAASTGIVLDHSGYALDPQAAQEKARRNLALLDADLAQHPDDEYVHFQRGKALQALERHADAADAFLRGLAAVRFTPGVPPAGRLGPVGRSVLTGLVVNGAYALTNAGAPDRAAALLEEHAALGHAGTRRADFEHARGYVHLVLGDVPRSRAAYEASLRHGAAGEDVLGTGTHASAYHLGLLAEADRDLAGAFTWYRRALELKPGYREALRRCLDLPVEAGVPLPPDVVAAADATALATACADRVEAYLRAGDTGAVSRFIEAVAAWPALLQACRDTLARYA